MIPDEEQALKLHTKYGSNERIVKHCKTVAKVATLIAEQFVKRGKNVNIDVVRAGAFLHDIGRTVTHTAKHGQAGAEILEKECIDKRVVETVRRHVGAGITKEEARKLGLPELDYVPKTLEERIVCFADKMVDSDFVRPFEKEVRRFEAEGHDKERLLALKENLKRELGEDPESIVMNLFRR